MPATRKDLVHDIGTNLELDIQYTDAQDIPVDLTTFTAHLMVLEIDRGSVIADITVNGDNSGWIKFNVAPSVSSNWQWAKAAYNVEIHDTAGNIKRLLFGELTLRRGYWL